MELALAMTTNPDAARPPATGEAALVAASQRGDARAFADLVRLHQHRVFRIAGRFFRRRPDIEDVAQETFLAAWRRLGTYQARAPFEHWLTRVCLNCCYASIRRVSSAERPLEVEPPSGAAPDPTAALEVQRLLQHLAPHDRFILLLLDGEGWSVGEIADRLGWSKVNVKVRAHRARRRLRLLLERK